MGNTDGSQDQKRSSRTNKKGFYAYTYSRRSRNVRCQSKSFRNQPERAYRISCTQSSIFSPRTANDGGIIRQLIKDYRDQVASARNQVIAKKAEIKNLEEEAGKLEFRIQEFEILEKQLQQKPKKNSIEPSLVK